MCFDKIYYYILYSRYSKEDCGRVDDDIIQLIYIALCGIFTIHFIIRVGIKCVHKLFFVDRDNIYTYFTTDLSNIISFPEIS